MMEKEQTALNGRVIMNEDDDFYMPSNIFMQNDEPNNDNEFAPSGTMCFFEVVQSSSKSSSQHSLASKKKKKKTVKSQGGVVNELVSFGGTSHVDT